MDELEYLSTEAAWEMINERNTEIASLEETIKQQAAVIEQMREFLCVIHRSNQPWSMNDLRELVALQPFPEVLNKVRADAIRKFGVAYGREYKEAIILPFTEHYAQRIEKGEA